MNIKTRLDPEIYDLAVKAAQAEGMSLSEYLNLILERDLANRNLERSDESKEQ